MILETLLEDELSQKRSTIAIEITTQNMCVLDDLHHFFIKKYILQLGKGLSFIFSRLHSQEYERAANHKVLYLQHEWGGGEHKPMHLSRVSWKKKELILALFDCLESKNTTN